MKNQTVFRRGRITDVPIIMNLIRQRIEWMDRKGICQWNKTHYLEHYPESYYEQAAEAGQLYVLERSEEKRIVGSVVLLDEDPRWQVTETAAYYVHNLVAALGEKHAGAELIGQVEVLARTQNKTFVRLDCALGNERLNRWYEELGYEARGLVTEGEYQGCLRERQI